MDLEVQKREKFGKAVRQIRRGGWIPAELYGRSLENLHLMVPAREVKKIFKQQAGESQIINLIFDNERRPVLIKDFQIDPISDEVLSLDFYQVRLDEKVRVRVPIEFVGVSTAVKDKGGILVKAMHDIEIEALPTNIPQTIKADLGILKEIGQSLYVKNLAIVGDFKLLVDSETVVATIAAPVSEEKEAATAQTIDVSSVKVETEEKKQEREAAKTASSGGTTEASAAKPTAEKK